MWSWFPVSVGGCGEGGRLALIQIQVVIFLFILFLRFPRAERGVEMDVKRPMDPFPSSSSDSFGWRIAEQARRCDQLGAIEQSLAVGLRTSCCAIEMMSTASAKYDWSRFGFKWRGPRRGRRM